jgi:sortase B
VKKLSISIILITALFFLNLAIKEELPYIEAKEKNKDIRKDYVSDQKQERDREINFTALQAINPDIIGWIFVPGTAIDYPILQNSLYDSYYLTHDFTGGWSELGAIFIQKSENAAFEGQHTIIYGHNLVDDQMFGSLSIYANQNIRDAQPYIYIYLPEKTIQYEIYSAYECLDGTETYQMTYADENEFQKWISFTTKNSNYTVMDPRGKDYVLTLSTCTDSGSYRFVVHSIINQIIKK